MTRVALMDFNVFCAFPIELIIDFSLLDMLYKYGHELNKVYPKIVY